MLRNSTLHSQYSRIYSLSLEKTLALKTYKSRGFEGESGGKAKAPEVRSNLCFPVGHMLLLLLSHFRKLAHSEYLAFKSKRILAMLTAVLSAGGTVNGWQWKVSNSFPGSCRSPSPCSCCSIVSAVAQLPPAVWVPRLLAFCAVP